MSRGIISKQVSLILSVVVCASLISVAAYADYWPEQAGAGGVPPVGSISFLYLYQGEITAGSIPLGSAPRPGAVIGFYGPSGRDNIFNDEPPPTGGSDAGNMAPPLTLSGTSKGGGTTDLISEVVGLDAGNGKDFIENTGVVTAVATVQADLLSIPDQTGKKEIPSVYAAAIGIKGGNGKDTVINSGSVSASAKALIGEFSITAQAAAGSPNKVTPLPESLVTTYAVGIDGGNGKDLVVDSGGSVTVEALTQIDTMNLTLTLGDNDQEKVDIGVHSQAIGFDGGNGKDVILNNSGQLSVSSTTEVSDFNINVSGEDNVSAEVGVLIGADAVGLRGSNGKDSLTNSGDFDVTSNATGKLSIDDDIEDGDVLGDITVKASAVGIDGGNGKDDVLNTGSFTVSSNALMEADSMYLTLGQFAAYDAPMTAWADAVGILAGHAKDPIINEGQMDVTAAATAKWFNLSASLMSTPVDIDWENFTFTTEAVGKLTAKATATGIEVDKANDLAVNSSGVMNVTAVANADSDEFTATLLNLGTFDMPMSAEAEATGVAAGSGKDVIENSGEMNISSEASANWLKIEAAVIDIPLPTKTSGGLTAEAVSVGVDADQGKDRVVNSGTMNVSADSDAVFGNVSADLVNLGIFDTPLTANAGAAGMVGAHGDDELINEGNLNVSADSKAISWGVTLSAVDAGLLSQGDSSTNANASAIGIGGGDGVDDIDNTGSISATSYSLAVHENASIAYKGSARNDSKAEAIAESTGIDAGVGDEFIQNDGSVTAGAEAHAVSANLQLSQSSVPLVSTIGDFLFEGYNELSVDSQASAVGIDGGQGMMELENNGDISAYSTATANSVTADVDLSITLDKKKTDEKKTDSGKKGGGLGIKSVFSTITDMATTGYKLYSIFDSITGADESEESDAFVDLSTQAHSYASGVISDVENEEADIVKSTGTITANAFAEASETSASINIATGAETSGTKNTKANTSSGAFAGSVGVATGLGDDLIETSGTVDVDSLALSFSTGVGVSVKKAKTDASPKGFGAATSIIESKTTSIAEAIGLDGEQGQDEIINSGSMNVDAVAAANSASVAVAVKDAAKFEVGVAFADTSTTSIAAAVGESGGEGDDTLLNNEEATISVGADSLAFSESVSVNAQSDVKGLILGGALALSATESAAAAVGMDGGSGTDNILNQGFTEATAISAANSLGVGVDVQGEVKGLAVNVPFTDTSTTSTAIARGLSGGAGIDSVASGSTGSVKADAQSYAFAESVSVGVQGDVKGVELQSALSFSAVTATADAVGIEGGVGDTPIFNQGAVEASAVTGANSLGVSVGVQGDVKGLAADVPFSDTSTTAASTATGIDGHELETVHSTGTNASVKADAQSYAFAEGVSVGVVGDVNGVVLQGALTFSAVKADADAVGIVGGFGYDEVQNVGVSEASALTVANSLGVSVGVQGDVKGVGVNVPFADTSTTSTAEAASFFGGEGNDSYINESTGTVTVDADSYAFAESVSVGVQGDVNGVGIESALSFSAVKSTADAVGADGGQGDDEITNAGLMEASSATGANSLGVGVSVQGDVNGVGISAAYTDTSTITTATATGLTGGEGVDTLINRETGTIDVDADSYAFAESVSVGVQGQTNGLTLGGALALSNIKADSYAVGIQGGYGDMPIINDGAVNASTTSAANSLGVGVGVQGDVNGVGVGVTFTDTSTTTTANSTGIDAGEVVSVSSSGPVSAAANSFAFAESVSVGVLGAANGVTLGGALSLSNTLAGATATGIIGGYGADWISNDEFSQASAISAANSLGVGVGVQGDVNGVGIGAAFTDTSTTTTAVATVFDGREGDDDIINTASGTIDAYADSFGFAESVSVEVQGQTNGVTLGGALALSGVEVTAEATGVEGGFGDDNITNQGLTQVDALTVANSLGVGVGVQGEVNGVGIGVAFTDTSTITNASATGLSGGEGADDITNGETGTIDVTADAFGFAESVSVEVQGQANGVTLGGALALSGVEVTAEATGAEGGSGDDNITNQGLTQVDAVTAANSLGVGVGVQGDVNGVGIGAAFTNTSTIANAAATGLSGGEGTDILVNSETGMIDVGADTYAFAESVSVEVQGQTNGVTLGGALALSGVEADAEAIGMDSGPEGETANDEIHNEGAVDASATTAANSLGVGVGVQGQVNGVGIGAAFTNTSTTTTATATGIDGTDSAYVYSSGPVSAAADSYAFAESVSVEVQGSANGITLGAALSLSNTLADAFAVGVAGGYGDDWILNDDLSKASATTAANSLGVGVGVQGQVNGVGIGAAFTDTSTTTTAVAAVFEGHEGDDLIVNTATGTIDADADAFGFAESVSVDVQGQANGVVLGGALSLSGVDVNAEATGAEGGSGDDELVNEGSTTVDATTAANSLGVSVGVQGQVNGVGIGVAFTNTSTTADSSATGFSGGEGTDTLTNKATGTIDVGADTYGFAESVSVEVQGQANGVTLGGPLALSGVETTAGAVGIEGGMGDDGISNEGLTRVSATTAANSLGIGVGVQGQVNGVGIGAAFTNTSTTSASTATGLAGGEGMDSLVNSETGTIDVDAETYGFAESVSVGVQGQANGVVLGGALALSGVETTAEAIGAGGGAGDDKVINSGLTQVDATTGANSLGVSVGVQGQVNGVGLGIAFTNTSTTSESTATGLAGGEGMDNLVNSETGTINADAETYAFAESVSVEVQGQANGLTLGGPLSFSATQADATAVGMDSGPEGEIAGGEIFNSGAVKASATSAANSLGVGVGVQGQVNGVGIGAAFTDTSTITTANATGIDGATSTYLYSNTPVSSEAESYAFAESVSVQVQGQANGVVLGGPLSFSSTQADSTALGILGGYGDDWIYTNGFSETTSYSLANSLGLSVGVQGQVNGVGLGAAFTDTSTITTANATGASSGDGADTLIVGRLGTQSVSSESQAFAESVSVQVQGQANGVVLNGALGFSATSAESETVGLSGDGGDDVILNYGYSDIDAGSLANSLSASVKVQGQVNGVAAGVAFTDATTNTNAAATGFSGGDGGDYIENSSWGVLDVDADSDSYAESLTVAVQGEGNGVMVQGTFSDSSTYAGAQAYGIDGGEGGDEVSNYGFADIDADATTNSTSVSLTVQGVVLGVGAQVALTDSSATAGAVAGGLSGGGGNDLITNSSESPLTVDADSTVSAQAVSLEVKGGSAVSVGGALSDSRVDSTAAATGISGGGGEDTVLNNSAVNVTSDSDAVSVSVSLSVTGAGGITAGAALADTTATSSAFATGIDAGDDNDTVINKGAVNSIADATGDAVSVSLQTGGFSIGLGAALARAATTAEAEAAGILGGGGDDDMTNTSIVLADADSDATGVSVAVQLNQIGASFTDVSTTSAASATGMAGEAGNDTITNTNEGAVIADSYADADSQSIAISLALGVSSADATSTATADAAGVSGGEGDDNLYNYGTIDALSTANNVSNAISVSMYGLADADASSVAETEAVGMDGGNGFNLIFNDGDVDVDALSIADTTVVAVTLAGQAASKANTTADATARGLWGGTGNDQITNSAELTVTAESTSDGGSVGITLAGNAPVTSETEASAQAIGIDEKDGINEISNEELINVNSTAAADASSAAVTLVGQGAATAGTTAESDAKGIWGGTGDDTITNTVVLLVTSTAEATSGAVGVTLAGNAPINSEALAVASATGIDDRDGSNIISNEGIVIVGSTADSDASGTAVTLAGQGAADAVTTSIASATGIAGGEGGDEISNTGALSLVANATGKAGSVGVTLAGYSPATVGTEIVAEATGIEGKDGVNYIDNSGSIDVLTTTTSNVSSTSVTLVGVASAEGLTTGTATATGISVGTGSGGIENSGDVDVDTISVMTLDNASFNLAGAASSTGRIVADTESMGLFGGDGDSSINTTGQIDVNSTSTMTAANDSAVGFGASGSVGSSGADAKSVGIDGGGGSDNIDSGSTIHSTATSIMVQNSSSFTFGGTGETSATLAATTEAVGIAGGAGALDTIRSQGAIGVVAASTLLSLSGSVTPFGTSGAGVISGAITMAAGIAGGEGDDDIENLSTIHVDADSIVTQIGSSFTFGGTGEAGGSLTAATHAVGISGGAGALDTIYSQGAIDVHATSTLTSVSGSVTPFGTSDAGATIGAVTTAAGIDGGEGDDDIDNFSTINVDADSIVTQNGSSFTFGGTGEARGSLAAVTYAIGIAGGTGWDTIYSQGAINVDATSILTSISGSVTPFGTSDVGATIGAVTTAAGIDGGEGNDDIDNFSTINVDADSIVTQSGSSFTFGGTGDSKGTLAATTNAAGISGGAGSDDISNNGTVDVQATSTLNSSGDSDTVFGTADATATSGAVTTAAGINGGEGDDNIESFGVINVGSTATLNLGNSTFNFGGTSAASGALTASTYSSGIIGGDGEDWVQSSGWINVAATSFLTSTSDSETIFGTSNSAGTTIAKTNAFGIETGNENDIIENSAQINVYTTTTASSDQSSYVFGGGSSSDAVLAADAESAGISAGSGDDQISNTGDITLITNSSITSTGGAYAEFGVSEARGLAVANATATGIDDGDGEDEISNSGAVTIIGAVTASADHSTDTGWLFGDGDSESKVRATVTGVGMDLGQGINTVLNDDAISLRMMALADTYSYSDGADIIDGNAKSTSNSTATGNLVGIQAGNGTNNITNSGTIDVETSRTYVFFTLPVWATATATADGDGIAGDGSAYATATATSNAGGIRVGVGTNNIQNEDGITVTAASWGTATSNADADEQGTDRSSSTVSLTNTAYGIKVGGGTTTVTNTGSIEASAEPYAVEVRAVSDAGFALGNVDAEATAVDYQTAVSEGISVGTGDAVILNDSEGLIKSTASAGTGSFYASADGDGINGDGDAWGFASFTTNSLGVGTGNGNQIVTNLGGIQVEATSTFNGTVVSDGDEGAHANSYFSTSSSASAIGVRTGTGTDLITNSGLISVESSPSVDKAYADADGGSPYSPVDSWSYSYVYMSSYAAGIETGHGNKEIVNNGSVIVDSLPYAVGQARGDGDSGTGVSSGDGWAYATVVVNATANGISTGTGQNSITNNGTIRATALATGNAVTTADGDDYGDATANSQSYAYAYARGVKTGSGSDTITNNGTIEAYAAALPYASAYADGGWAGDSYPSVSRGGTAEAIAVDADGGNNVIINNGIIRAYVTEEILLPVTDTIIGIKTGSGNDTIVNNGIIEAAKETTVFGIPVFTTPEVAIDSGSGNDQVTLGANSLTYGSIYLREGNDGLTTYNNATVNGAVDGGADYDSLVINGTANFSTLPVNFESTIQQSAGTAFFAAGLETMDQLVVNNGVIEIEGDYAFSPTGTLQAQLFGTGTSGLLKVNDTASLGGVMNIIKAPQAFADGQVYTVFEVGEVAEGTAFDDITLPYSSPLLSFTLFNEGNLIQVRSNAESFTIVADNEVQNTIAEYIDDIIPSLNGDLSTVIGEFQSLPGIGYDTAFASLSPVIHGNATQSGLDSVGQYLGSVRSRLGQRMTEEAAGAREPILVAYNDPGASLGRLLGGEAGEEGKPLSGLWARAFGKWGDQDGGNGYTGFDFATYGFSAGYDRRFRNDMIAGLGLGFAGTDIDLADDSASGDIGSLFLSGYGAYFPKDFYLEAVLSYGQQDYDSARRVLVGSIQRTASGSHDGGAYSAFVSGGYNVDLAEWRLQPFTSLEYISLDEDGFTETGAGGANLTVPGRVTDSFVSELGLRLSRVLRMEKYSLIPEFSLAWNHDFALDDRMLTAAFAGSPNTTFTIDDRDIERNGATVGAGLTLVTGKGIAVSLNYEIETRTDYWAHGVHGELRYEF